MCPVEIPLSDLLRKLREKQVERRLRPWKERAALAVWGFLALHPDWYALFTKLAVRDSRAHGRQQEGRFREAAARRRAGPIRATCRRRSAGRSASCTRRRDRISGH